VGLLEAEAPSAQQIVRELSRFRRRVVGNYELNEQQSNHGVAISSAHKSSYEVYEPIEEDADHIITNPSWPQ
jgi:hypothetical protein